MARVRMIKPEEADADTRKVYDGVRKQWGRISNFSQVLAHQPAALAGWMLPNETIRLANVKSDPDYVKIQQLVIIKTSALNQSAYCMSHNVPLGKKLGLTEAQIKAAQGSDYMRSPDLDDRQKAAIRWAEAVTLLTARDDDAAFGAMKQHFSEKQIVELTVFCGMWNYSNRLCEALHVDLERPDKRIDFSIDRRRHMPAPKTYTGGCHCGEVRFEVTTDLGNVVACNCSICQKRGALWSFVPPANFALRAGAENLKDYQFGKKSIHHLFCPQCGVGAFSRGTNPKGDEMIAVNVRCLDDVDAAALNPTPFDGRSL